MSTPCQSDLACYRDDGHTGDHAYPTPQTVPLPVAATPAPLDVLDSIPNPTNRDTYEEGWLDAMARVRAATPAPLLCGYETVHPWEPVAADDHA